MNYTEFVATIPSASEMTRAELWQCWTDSAEYHIQRQASRERNRAEFARLAQESGYTPHQQRYTMRKYGVINGITFTGVWDREREDWTQMYGQPELYSKHGITSNAVTAYNRANNR